MVFKCNDESFYKERYLNMIGYTHYLEGEAIIV